MTLQADNNKGRATKSFKLVVGETLALTPPMGWNHWYTYHDRVSDKTVRTAADVMISSGMADYGYQYVNIDDCWMVKPGSPNPDLAGDPRTADGTIRANKRFPDMKALTAYVHAKGLKAGIYTSPGPLTCAKFEGSYQHEEKDARTFAEWGFDFLKYDLCSYRTIDKSNTVEADRKPYELMGSILTKLSRDIVFNLCQYGRNDVWKWAAEVGGNCWRTTDDLGWAKATNLPGFYSIGFQNALRFEYAGPGRWNDPDYILIGNVGNTRKRDEPPRPTTLTPDEQYSYMSMWALMAAPLFYSGDMTTLDDFSLSLLCNTEVIDVDQDALGKQARIVRKSNDEFVLAKKMADGLTALGLFNLSEGQRDVSVTWADLGVTGAQRVRDVWRQKDIGTSTGNYSVSIARHGVVFVRLFAK